MTYEMIKAMLVFFLDIGTIWGIIWILRDEMGWDI